MVNFTKIPRGVCLFYHSLLPLNRSLHILSSGMDKTRVGNKICNLYTLYRSPSQAKDEFENFVKDIEHNLEHINNKSPSIVLLDGIRGLSNNIR